MELEERLARTEAMLLARVADVERVITLRPPNRASLVLSRDTPSHAAPVVCEDDRITTCVVVQPRIFRGKGFKSKYYGPSHGISLMSQVCRLPRLSKSTHIDAPQFPELSSVLERLGAQPVFVRAQQEVRVLDKACKRRAEITGHVTNDLFDALPSRETVDLLVRLYLSVFESMYRVLHVPTFWRDYAAFGAAPNRAQPAFVAILLSMIAAVACAHRERHAKFVGVCSLANTVARRRIAICDRWVEQHSQKHLTLEYFQVRCLLLLAKRINGVKEKQQWTEARTLLNFAMSAGYHLDPKDMTANKETIVFDQEVRRRLWSTIVELDLLASFGKGMPPAFMADSWMCAAPSCLDDEDIDVDTKKLPKARDANHVKTWFSQALRKTLPLRLELISLINNSTALHYDEFLKYQDRINDCLSPFAKSPSTLSWEYCVLRIQMNSLLMLLHRSAARSSQSSTWTKFSRMMVTECASIVLEESYAVFTNGSTVPLFLTCDVILAVLCLCHNIVIHEQRAHAAQQAEGTLNQGLEILEEKAFWIGSGLHHWMVACMAVALVKAKGWPEQAPTFEQRAIDGVTSMLYKILSSQDIPNPTSPGDGRVALQSNEWRQTMLAPSPVSFAPQRYGPLFDTPNLGDMDFSCDLNDLWNF